MPVSIIVSYDGTTNDDDALVLGRMLAGAGASLALAYVRHSREYDPRREEIGEHDAQRRLDQGRVWIGDDSVPTLVTVNASTSAGLAALAAQHGADLIVFGSDYRTPPGRVEPQGTAQGLLDGGATAVGVAAAGIRADSDAATITTVSVAGAEGGAAWRSATALVAATGAELVGGGREADLILVDSRPGTEPGHVALDGATRSRLDAARGSVIVVAGDAPLSF